MCNRTGTWNDQTVELKCDADPPSPEPEPTPEPTPDPDGPTPDPDPVDVTPFLYEDDCSSNMTNCDYNTKCMTGMKEMGAKTNVDISMCVHYSTCANTTQEYFVPSFGPYQGRNLTTKDAKCINSTYFGMIGHYCEAPEQCNQAKN